MGVVQGAQVQLGQWTGKESIKVIPLDDYEFIVGLDFLDHINALLVPFTNCLCILDPRYQCIVLVRLETDQATKVLSAIQLAKGVRKNEETLLAALKLNEAPKDMSEIPPKVLDVLESFKDVMPSELPKLYHPSGR